jgi:hypothetical protein
MRILALLLILCWPAIAAAGGSSHHNNTQINGQFNKQSASSTTTVVDDNDYPANSAPGLLFGPCSAAASLQGNNLGGALGSMDPLCSLAVVFQMHKELGDTSEMVGIAKRAAEIADSRTNKVIIWCNEVPILRILCNL